MPEHEHYDDYLEEFGDYDGRSDIGRLNALIQTQIEIISVLERLLEQTEILSKQLNIGGKNV